MRYIFSEYCGFKTLLKGKKNHQNDYFMFNFFKWKMISFILLFNSICIFQTDFNIQSPIFSSNISEIGMWALRGSAINMKKFIRLTSLLTNDYDGLCSFHKTFSNDWQIYFNFSFKILIYMINLLFLIERRLLFK